MSEVNIQHPNASTPNVLKIRDYSYPACARSNVDEVVIGSYASRRSRRPRGATWWRIWGRGIFPHS